MYYRKKAGKKFTYVSGEGTTVTEKQLISYFKTLVIPPAWTHVEINASPRAKICATGYDAKGRKQYIYNPKFREKREDLKFKKLIDFGDRLCEMRKNMAIHLRKKKMGRAKVLAAMVRMMEVAYFRPGNDLYTLQNESFGLTTLQRKHLAIKGSNLQFNYLGKSGKLQEKSVKDVALSKIIKELAAMPGKEIFKFIDQNNKIHDVKSRHLNQYIHQNMGPDFSAKDFRTWGGSVLASKFLDESGAAGNKTATGKNIREAIKAVSEKLGNTPAVARKSYINPCVFKHYEKGKTLTHFQKEAIKPAKKQKELSLDESAFLCMMKTKPGKK